MNIYILDDQEMILETVAEQLSEYAGSITTESNPGIALKHLIRKILLLIKLECFFWTSVESIYHCEPSTPLIIIISKIS